MNVMFWVGVGLFIFGLGWFIHAYRTRRVSSSWRVADPELCEICGERDGDREAHGMTVCYECEGLLP